MNDDKRFKQETFSFPEDSHFHLFRTSEKQKLLHCHDCLELNLAEAGTGKYIIGGKLYPICPGDLFVINNSERHLAVHDGEELTMTVIVFDSEYVGKKYGQDYLEPFYCRKENFSNRIHPDCADYPEMLRAFACMKMEEGQQRVGWQMVMEAAANMLLALLYRHYKEQKELKDQQTDMRHAYGRISKALDYVDHHFAEPVTLDQLAAAAAMSKTYLCKCFKEITGQTLFVYLEQVRIQYACYSLQTSEKPVAFIAMEAGFESVSYFNRIFKKLCGCTPLQYRKGTDQIKKNL